MAATLTSAPVTARAYDDFLLEYWRERPKGRDGKYFRLHLGQAFCQAFDITDTSLYYVQDEGRTLDLMEQYVAPSPRP